MGFLKWLRLRVLYGVWVWSCWHLANGNKTCPHLFTHVIFKNFVAHGSQGYVRQSLSNHGTRVEQPSVLNKFFSELQYSALFGCESRKFAGVVSKYAKFRHFLAHAVV